MNYELSAYAIAQFITAFISLIVTIIMWNRRSSRGGLVLFLLFLAIFEWAFCAGMEAAAINQETKIFWSKIEYLGAHVSPVLYLIFSIQYSGKDRMLSVIKIGLFFVIPLLIIILAITNDQHGLIWIGFSPGPPGSNSLIYHHGPFFWIGIAYIFTIMSFATTTLILGAVQTQKIYRFQFYIITLAAIMPWIGMIVYIFDISPFPGLDTTCISFLFTGLLLMLGISRVKLFNYDPIAHELLFRNINDGVFVFDENFRLIDMNGAAEIQVSKKFHEIIGTDLRSISELQPIVEKMFKKDQNNRFEIVSPLDHLSWFNINISPLNERKRFRGWVAISEDITRRKEIETQLQQLNKRLTRQLDENKELQVQLREQANRDSLTGVYNRGYMSDTLIREIARAERKNYPISLIMLDVDHFKIINDTFGHKTGDKVVIALGKMLEVESRKADCVSRFGGDEFILVMPEMNIENAYQRAEIWRNNFSKLNIPGIEKDFKITISIGIACFPADGSDADSLLDAADQALYLAKQSGRDCTRKSGR